MPVASQAAKTVLTLKERPHVPLEAEVLTPDVIAVQAHDQIRSLPVVLGKRQHRLDEFFAIDGSPSEELEIHGDLGRVKWIGRGMTRGRITIHGDAGMHLGAYMKGGAIEVTGNASDWVGAEMSGGFIRVSGNAGGQIGAAYRGSLAGMKGGAILIGGSAGIEVGMRMKRGIIALRGPVRDFAGLQMKGGTIVLMGGAEIRTGAWMIRGTIIALKPVSLLPTFAYACAYSPVFLRLYANHLQTLGFRLPVDERDGHYQRYSGDTAVPGKGEILIWQPRGA
jgi:formylmethanofuran dehydrogenase subunit C